MREIAIEAARVFFRIGGTLAGIGAGLFICFLLLLLAMRILDEF